MKDGQLASSSGETTYKSELSKVECEVYGAWRRLFNVEQWNPDENFFDLGGDSLIAMNLVTELAAHFAIRIPAVLVFKYPTARELANFIETALPKTRR